MMIRIRIRIDNRAAGDVLKKASGALLQDEWQGNSGAPAGAQAPPAPGRPPGPQTLPVRSRRGTE